MPSEKDGVMIILSSPSGAGKTTLVKKLSEKDNFEISVSHTTRSPRSNEVDGVDYKFVNTDNFKKLVSNNQFYEYAKIFGNYYGTSRKNVDEDIKKNDIIYWKGHVALAISNKKLIHAYGPMKKTVVMGISQTIKRIEKTAKLKVIGIKRL